MSGVESDCNLRRKARPLVLATTRVKSTGGTANSWKEEL
jgi:hypothetical protein